jgi:tetratricopeptide (TPR) repeat protein
VSETTDHEWERRLAEVWASADDLDDAELRARVGVLAAERPAGDAIALFELGGADDSTGRPDEAEAHYRQALDAGLAGERRRRAVIQLASTLRNLGRVEESVALLTAERDAGSDELDDAVAAFLALALVDAGREREATGIALEALAAHLPRYNRSLANYAQELRDSGANVGA